MFTTLSDLSYHFVLRPARREAAFFHALFLTYPSLVGRYVFGRRPTGGTVLCLLFSPLLALRNFANGILCTFPFCPDIEYRLTLHDSHLSFGLDIARAQVANSYSSIEAVFKAKKHWCALLHDGYIVYLPPEEAGDSAVRTIRDKQRAQQDAAAADIP